MGSGITYSSRDGGVLNAFSDFSVTFIFKVIFVMLIFFLKYHFVLNVSVVVNVKVWYLCLQK